MKFLLLIRLFFVVALAPLCGGCPPLTLPVLTTVGTSAVVANKFVDYKLTKRSLDLKEREIILKEKAFELQKEGMK